MDRISVRKLDINDVENFRNTRLSALKTNPEAFGSVYEEQINWPMTRFQHRLETADMWGAFIDTKLVGIVGFNQEQGQKIKHKGVLTSFFVEPDMRGRGVGSALLAAALEGARTRVEQVMLTVVVSNESARSLYQKFGFVQYGLEPRAMKTADGYSDEILLVLIF